MYVLGEGRGKLQLLVLVLVNTFLVRGGGGHVQKQHKVGQKDSS